MEANPVAHIASLLYQSYTETDNDIRRDVEDTLEEYQNDFVNYFLALCEIVISEDQGISENVKVSACSNIKNTIKSNAEREPLPYEQKNFYVEKIYNMMIKSNVSEKIKSNLGLALCPLLAIQSNDLQGDTIMHLFPHLLASLSGNNIDEYIAALIAVRSIFTAVNQHKTLDSCVEQIVEPMVRVAGMCMEQPQSATGVVFLKAWNETLDNILRYILVNSGGNLPTSLATYDTLASTLERMVLQYTEPSNSGTSIFHLTPTGEQQDINELTIAALTNLNTAFDVLSNIVQPGPGWIRVGTSLNKMILYSLYDLCALPDYQDWVQMDSIGDLAMEAMRVVAFNAGLPEMQQFFNQEYKNILIPICFLLIKASPNEYMHFADDPTMFVSSTNEDISNAEGVSVKCSASALIKAFCDKIDGCLQYLTKLLTTLLLNTIKPTENQDPMLAELSNTSFMQSTPEQLIETALYILCLLPDSLEHRQDLVFNISTDFDCFLYDLLFHQNDFVKARVCLFSSYYTEILTSGNLMEEIFQFVIRCLESEPSNPAVTAQASETLSQISHINTEECSVESLMPDALDRLIPLIIRNKDESFFDGLYSIIPYLTENFNHGNLHMLFNNALERINILVPEIETEPNSIIINKLLDILSITIEEDWVISNYPDLVIELVVPVFNHIINPELMQIEDKLLALAQSLIKSYPAHQLAVIDIIQFMPKVFENNKRQLLDMYALVQILLEQWHDALLEKQDYFIILMDILVKALLNQKGKVDKIQLANSALLLHYTLLMYKGQINDHLPAFFNTVLERQKTWFEFPTSLRVQVLNIMLALAYCNPAACLELMFDRFTETGQVYFEVFLEQLHEFRKFYATEYDKKLIVIGVLELITNGGMGLSNKAPEMITILIRILSSSTQVSNEEDTAQELVYLAMSSDEELDIETQQQSEDAKTFDNELVKQISGMKTCLDSFNKFSYFRDAMEYLKQNNSELFMSILQQLSEKNRQALIQIISTTCVTTGTESYEERRIARPKRPSQ